MKRRTKLIALVALSVFVALSAVAKEAKAKGKKDKGKGKLKPVELTLTGTLETKEVKDKKCYVLKTAEGVSIMLPAGKEDADKPDELVGKQVQLTGMGIAKRDEDGKVLKAKLKSVKSLEAAEE